MPIPSRAQTNPMIKNGRNQDFFSSGLFRMSKRNLIQNAIPINQIIVATGLIMYFISTFVNVAQTERGF